MTSPLWALAHTTQFAPVGWHYAAHDAGVQMLHRGGSFVTRVSPDGKDFSIVVEKMNGGGEDQEDENEKANAAGTLNYLSFNDRLTVSS